MTHPQDDGFQKVQTTVLIEKRVKRKLEQQADKEGRPLGRHAGILLRDAVGFEPQAADSAA